MGRNYLQLWLKQQSISGQPCSHAGMPMIHSQSSFSFISHSIRWPSFSYTSQLMHNLFFFCQIPNNVGFFLLNSFLGIINTIIFNRIWQKYIAPWGTKNLCCKLLGISGLKSGMLGSVLWPHFMGLLWAMQMLSSCSWIMLEDLKGGWQT